MDDNDIIIQELEAFNERLKADMKSKKFHDTEKTANSLRVISGNGHFMSVGNKTFRYLNRGSFAWNGDPLVNMRILGYILDISGWAARKGINPYAAASVIVKKGNQVARGIRQGLELEKKVEEVRRNLVSKLAVYHRDKVIVTLNEAHKRLKNVS